MIVGTPVVSRREAPHLLDTVEEPFHEIALTVDPAAEAECLLSIGRAGIFAQHLRCSAKLRIVSVSYACR